ncbi:hypothetical protein [Paenibacillus sp. NPDC058071]|uniref:hypothetical protein n=1 Tax=Paenibacillus sp. NPDC058071 TaxID=3346326 RepID=UPI0036DBF01E
MAKRMIIKGVGQFMAKRYAKDGKGVEVITLGSLQDLAINLNVEIEDIFGGDGLFAIDTLVTSKSIEITATDAKFDLAALELMMGSRVQEKVENQSLWVLGEQSLVASGTVGASVSAGKSAVKYGDTLFDDGNFQVRLKDSNTLLNRIAPTTSSAPEDGEFFVETVAGSPNTVNIVVSPDHIGKDLVINYQRKETVDVVDILRDEVPFPVHVIHHGAFLQKDGTYQGVETELYQCIANGQFTLDAARSTASTSSISLKVIDPERADGKLGSIKRFTQATK